MGHLRARGRRRVLKALDRKKHLGLELPNIASAEVEESEVEAQEG